MFYKRIKIECLGHSLLIKTGDIIIYAQLPINGKVFKLEHICYIHYSMTYLSPQHMTLHEGTVKTLEALNTLSTFSSLLGNEIKFVHSGILKKFTVKENAFMALHVRTESCNFCEIFNNFNITFSCLN